MRRGSFHRHLHLLSSKLFPYWFSGFYAGGAVIQSVPPLLYMWRLGLCSVSSEFSVQVEFVALPVLLLFFSEYCVYVEYGSLPIFFRSLLFPLTTQSSLCMWSVVCSFSPCYSCFHCMLCACVVLEFVCCPHIALVYSEYSLRVELVRVLTLPMLFLFPLSTMTSFCTGEAMSLHCE